MSNEKLTKNNLITEEADQYKNGGKIVWDAEDRRLAKKDQYNSEYRFIRWSYWFEKPLIKCHEAILLTLGFDPESTYYPERMWVLEFSPEDRVALEDRVENFKMLIGKGRLFESEKEGDLNLLVKLSDVAQYLDDRKISLPPELKAYIASKEDRCYQLQQQIEQLQTQLAQAQELIKQLKINKKDEKLEIQTTHAESKLGTREENNIIRVLAVLADMEKKIDLLKPYEAHGILLNKAELLGVDKFPSSESIKKWFTKANEYKNPN